MTFAAALFVLAQIVNAPDTSPLSQPRAPVPVARPPGAPAAPSVAVERNFALVALEGSSAEIAMAKLALARSHNDETRAYAIKMISEHDGLLRALRPLLEPLVPSTRDAEKLSPQDALAYDQLAHASAVQFDQTYALDQVAGHLSALGAFRAEANDGERPAIKRLASEWVDDLSAHLQLAVALAQHVGGSNPIRGAQ